jgi:Ion channel
MLCGSMSSGPEPVGGHRYGIVLALALLAVVFLVVAPDGTGSRAVALLIVGAMLVVVIATSRSDPAVRERGAGLAGVAVVAVALTVALGWLPKLISGAIGLVIVLLTLVQLVRGLLRLLRVRGVTVQAVAGALAVYLLLGILFAFAIGVAAKAGSGSYFAQGTDGNESQHVYFSFTAMTTTGFGDLSPAAPTGRALAVLEMLLGQIYLVTVISLLVGNLRRRGEPGAA